MRLNVLVRRAFRVSFSIFLVNFHLIFVQEISRIESGVYPKETLDLSTKISLLEGKGEDRQPEICFEATLQQKEDFNSRLKQMEPCFVEISLVFIYPSSSYTKVLHS